MSQSPLFDIFIEDRVLIMRVRGIWSVEEGDRFLETLATSVTEFEDETPWATFVDFSQWQPDRSVIGRAAIAADMVNKAGRSHGAYVFGSLEFGQAIIEHSVIDPKAENVRYFPTEARARSWLASLGYLRNP